MDKIMKKFKNQFKGLGAAFFPEHHPVETWGKYIDLMAEAGIGFVRIGEFSWDKLEPEEGTFDFEWLDKVFTLLARYEIDVLLCTPTAVPPVWACEKYPEILPVTQEGKTFGFGLRRYTCPTSSVYHHLSENIVIELGKRYGTSPQITGWQIDNEIGHPFCFCPRCLKYFQQWCRERYYDIENFNNSLGTYFLGQTFQRFSQIAFPNTYPHPSLWQVYHKFFSEKTVECFSKQAKWLRKSGALAPVTTNMMLTWYGYDHKDMAAHLDFISGDHYNKENTFGQDFVGEAFVAAYLRGLKPDRNIWFNELQCGRINSMPLPGQVRWWTLVQIGLGADGLNYFRWDTCPAGMERDTYGLIKPSILPGRVFDEIKDLNADLKKMQSFLDGTTPEKAEVAVLFSYENHCEFAVKPKHNEFQGLYGNGYPLHIAKHFRAIVENNIPVDIVYPDNDFSQYKCIIAPALYVLSGELVAKLKSYIESGGKCLLTPFSGVVDENAKMWNMPVPGPLSETFGVRITDYGAFDKQAGELKFKSSSRKYPFQEFVINKWIDEISVGPETEVLATYSGSFFNNIPALTRKVHGAGNAFYLGTWFENKDYKIFYKAFLESIDINPVMDLPEGIHVSSRCKEGLMLFFISNENPVEKVVNLNKYKNLITGKIVEGETVLSPFDVMVCEKI